jgi:ABC-type tungstate transport system substrate-binding protein
MNGFGFGIPFSPLSAFACATLGGAVGGMMICPRPMLAGLIGGLLAGTLGFAAVYSYSQHRERVANFELVIVQGIVSLPGLGIGRLLKSMLSPRSPVGRRGQRPGT